MRLVSAFAILVLLTVILAVHAQDDLPSFATNTPPPPELTFATPAAPIERYALRPWTAPDLQELLAIYVTQLSSGGVEAQKQVRLVQYELARRFPAAPRNEVDRQRLLYLMLNAPRGSVDMRSMARPYLETLLNQQGSDAPGEFEAGGFSIEVMAANLDAQPPMDAVLHVRYGPQYEDYLPALARAEGGWQVLSHEALPAAPLDNLQSLALIGIDDFNGDGLDEIALSLNWGEVNRELRILGWRNGELATLVQPGSPIHYAEILSWTPGEPFSLRQYRLEDSVWNCLAEQNVSVEWRGNLYRSTADAEGFYFQNTVNCLFYGASPLYAAPTDEALQTIAELLPYVEDDSDPVGQRARVIRTMIFALRGDIGTALAQAIQLQAEAEPGSWLAEQATVLASGLEQNIHPMEICAGLLAISADGACDIDAALGRLLEERPLQRDTPIAEQLAEMGIRVQAQMTVSQVGMADREVIRFEMAGPHWWAFAPLDADFYRAELAEPVESMMPPDTPLPVIVVPPRVYDALLRDNAPAEVLTVLGNIQRENPLAAISPEVRYLEALSLDLLGDRSRARLAYFDLWQQAALSNWGQLAAAHLEQR